MYPSTAHTILIPFFLIVVTFTSALPTNSITENNDASIKESDNSVLSGFPWTKYKIAAVTTAIIIVGAGLAALTALFFPIFVYKICYALGGCQNTLDSYVDKFIGVEGQTRKIKRRDVSDMDGIMEILKRGIEQYSNTEIKQENNVMRITKDHQIGKRSPLDYIEPVLVMISKAYNEFVDPELKKNFETPPFTR